MRGTSNPPIKPNVGSSINCTTYGPLQRRQQPRIDRAYAVTVRGSDVKGEAFNAQTTLDNIGAGGLYLALDQVVPCGAELSFVVSFTTEGLDGKKSSNVALRGKVLRSEPQNNGKCGVAVEFTEHRFL